MEYAKPWRSIDEQIDALVAKGMACCRNDLAEKLREVAITVCLRIGIHTK